MIGEFNRASLELVGYFNKMSRIHFLADMQWDQKTFVLNDRVIALFLRNEHIYTSPYSARGTLLTMIINCLFEP